MPRVSAAYFPFFWNPCDQDWIGFWAKRKAIYTDMIAVGKPMAYHDCEKAAIGSNVVLPN